MDVIELRKEYIGVSLKGCHIFLKFELRGDNKDLDLAETKPQNFVVFIEFKLTQK